MKRLMKERPIHHMTETGDPGGTCTAAISFENIDLLIVLMLLAFCTRLLVNGKRTCDKVAICEIYDSLVPG